MLKIGDRVKVMPTTENTADTIRKYIGHVFVVSKLYRYGTQRYYELVGCSSEKGVPYSFAEDWLTKIES